MKEIIFIFMLLIGTAGAVIDLSGTDASVFDQPKLAKDGVDGSSPMLTSSMADFMKDGDEINASLPGMKVLLLGSMVKMGEQVALPSMAAQVAMYLNGSVRRI